MRCKSGYIKAEVNSRSESGNRTYLITLPAPVTALEFTDLLVERKVIGSLDNQLRQAVKDAARGYLKSAESLVNALAKRPRRRAKNRSNDDDNDQLTLIPIRRLQ
jgi:hypothetical protein